MVAAILAGGEMLAGVVENRVVCNLEESGWSLATLANQRPPDPWTSRRLSERSSNHDISCTI